MIDENLDTTNDQYIAPLLLPDDDGPEGPKQDRRAPVERLYGIRRGAAQEGIQGQMPLASIASTFYPEDAIELLHFLLVERFKSAFIDLDRLHTDVDSNFPKAVTVRWADSGAYQPVFYGTESPTTDAEEAYADLSAELYPHIIVQWDDSMELQPRPLETESPTANADSGSASNIFLSEILNRLDDIAQREDNWDGYESKSPNKLSLDNARQFMNKFVDAIVSAGEVPLAPSLISSDEDGHITVVWHGEGRQLHLQIEENEVDYIQVWGPNIDTEMHVDTLHSKDYRTLWKWLLYG